MTANPKLLERLRAIKERDFCEDASEQLTKQSVILPLLLDLGWDIWDPGEAVPEFDCGQGRVDFALLISGKPRVLVEAKRFSEELDGHEEQLCNYAFKKGVEQAVLTNGLSWWFYLPLERGDWTDRKVLSINFEEQDENLVVERLEELLGKSNVGSGKSVKTSKGYLRDKQKESEIANALPDVWNQIITEPDSLLVDLLSETVEKKCGYKPETKLVREFLKKIPNIHAGTPDRPQTKPRPRITKPRRTYPAPVEKKKKGKEIWRKITFLGRSYSIKYQKEAIVIVAKTIYERQPSKFAQIAYDLGTDLRPWFTNNPRKIRDDWYAIIPGTNIFVLVHMSAEAKRKLIGDLLETFGYKRTDFKIIA